MKKKRIAPPRICPNCGENIPALLFAKHVGCPPREEIINLANHKEVEHKLKTLKFAQPEIISTCQVCKKKFIETRLQEHLSKCTKLQAPAGSRTAGKILSKQGTDLYCEHCGLTFNKRFFKTHSKKCAFRKGRPATPGEPHYVQGGIPSLGKRRP